MRLGVYLSMAGVLLVGVRSIRWACSGHGLGLLQSSTLSPNTISFRSSAFVLMLACVSEKMTLFFYTIPSARIHLFAPNSALEDVLHCNYAIVIEDVPFIKCP